MPPLAKNLMWLGIFGVVYFVTNKLGLLIF